SVSRAYFDGFIARHRAQLIERFDALARRGDAPAKRPRGGPRAVQILDRKLVFLPLSFLLDGRRYHTPYRTLETDEIVLELQADLIEGEAVAPRLVLHVAPRDTGRLAPLDLRGELHDASGDVVARFDWQSMPRAEVLSLSDDALARLFRLEAATPADAPRASEGDAEDAETQRRQDQAAITRALLPRRWAAELDLLDTMLAGGTADDTALHTRRYLEGRGVVLRRDGGVFEVNDARPIEWVITPGLALFARGHFYAAGPAEALAVLGRTLHRLGYPEPDPAIGPAFGVGRITARPHAELRRLLDTLRRQGIDPTTLIAQRWIAAVEMNLPIPLPPVSPEIRRLIEALSQAGISPRELERQGISRVQWDAHALPARDQVPALYEELLAHGADLDQIAARLPAQLGDPRALAQELLDDMSKKGLLSPDDEPAADLAQGRNHHD
ncbi:MAG: hypothetical protein JNK56_11505, partial [Myxococcales bacterium]|nr:hypothetical protein [Myxococcales bacterium]